MKTIKSLAVAAILVALAPGLRAQTPQVPVEKVLLDFLNPSICLVTSSSGKDSLGKTLWYNQASLYQRQVGYGAANMRMGIDYISLSENFLPFTGGDGLKLIGPSLRWQMMKPMNTKAQPYVTAGLYAGYMRSEMADVKKWAFAPSASVGVDFALGKAYTLTLDYRTTKKIEKISPDGIGLSIRMNLR